MSDEKDTKSTEAEPRKPKANHRKRNITIAVIVGIVVVAAVGVLVWHEQPSFCNAICHAPQDPQSQTYYAKSGEPALDKWGNEVEDAGDMMVVVHKEAGLGCLDCHEATIGQQATEGMHWVTGSYAYPLDERSLSDLNYYVQHESPDMICLNESCHNMTRDDLAKATAGTTRNPHVTEVNHQVMECSDCHKAHRVSVQACSRCHEDTEIPDGWLSAEESAEITSEHFAW